MISLERRLQLSLALSLFVLVTGLWASGHYALQQLTEGLILPRLQHDAEAMLAAMHPGEDGSPKIGRRRLTPVYNQPLSGHYYQVEIGDGLPPLLSRSLWDQNLDLPALPPGNQRHWSTPGPSGQMLLVWASGYRKLGYEFTLAVAEDITPIREKLVVAEWLFGAIAALGLFVLLSIQRLVIHHSFKSLEPVYDDIERLERGHVTRLTQEVPREIAPLVGKFNELLDLLAQRLERSRQALGNLAHALKTPLSLLQQEIEDQELAHSPGLRRSMSAQTERIRTLMDREFKRARLSGAATPGQKFDPASELPPLVGFLERVYAEKHLRIQWEPDDQGLQNADREDMLELLGNLMDNACKWAATRVRCRLTRVPDGVTYSIEDDGPGCPEDALANIVRRGLRLDESVEGQGFGLAIARDIVRLYGGELELDRSPDLNGLRARIRLPAS